MRAVRCMRLIEDGVETDCTYLRGLPVDGLAKPEGAAGNLGPLRLVVDAEINDQSTEIIAVSGSVPYPAKPTGVEVLDHEHLQRLVWVAHAGQCVVFREVELVKAPPWLAVETQHSDELQFVVTADRALFD